MYPAVVAEHSPVVRNVEYLETNLRALLASIRKTTLEPPLTEADFDPELLEKVKPAGTPDDLYRSWCETACKKIMYEIARKGTADDDLILIQFCNLLDLGLLFADLELTEAGLPLSLIEELFDSQTIPACDRLFRYLESRIDRITTGMQGGKGKALVLLRLCNELLRRLSKTEDTIFCGRILIFLSKSFPIGERSGVNLRGDFNVENVTVFDAALRDQPAPPADVMEVDNTQEPKDAKDANDSKDSKEGGGEATQESKTKTVSFEEQQALETDALYPIFWSLQNDFSDPTRLFVPENFEKFKSGLEATMEKFQKADEETVKNTGGQGKADSGMSGTKKLEERKGPSVGEKRKRDDLDGEESPGEGFNPKYLTSRELFELEISDLTFRRHVLVQAMILLDFLLSLTPAAKEKWKDLKNPNRAVQYAFTLSPEDETWALRTRHQISTSLQPDQAGRLFMRLINTVLTREQNWVRWKLEGCHPFDLPPLPPPEFEDAKLKAQRHCQADPPYELIMGTQKLNFIWRKTGVDLCLEDLGTPDRHRIPKPEDFRAGIKQDTEDLKDAMFPADIDKGQNAKYTKIWKSLRIASKDRLSLFNRFDDKFEEDRNDLEMLFKAEDQVREEAKRQRIAPPPKIDEPAPAVTSTPTPVAAVGDA